MSDPSIPLRSFHLDFEHLVLHKIIIWQMAQGKPDSPAHTSVLHSGMLAPWNSGYLVVPNAKIVSYSVKIDEIVSNYSALRLYCPDFQHLNPYEE